jgi:hypothetical protein
MHVFRFRVFLEDVDEFYRDIEILASSTFEQFHTIIKQSVELQGQELASFYMCDGKWTRRQEITLVDMVEDEDDEDEVAKAPLVMCKCKLAELIDDPHQRLVYVYDFLNFYEFNIELLKIIPADKKVKYPRCVRKSGIIPKPGSITPAPIPDDFDEDLVYEDAEAASSKDEDDTLGLYTISDEGGFEEAPPETFDDEKYI